MSENGVFDLQAQTNTACRTEEEVYALLDLPLIPPEMRLGVGEIEAAANGTLPSPVELSDLRGDFHMHCTMSDGSDSFEEMVVAAAGRGYSYHAISDHSPGRGRFGIEPDGLRRQRARASELGARSGVTVLCGSEVDILKDGALDYPDEVLAELDIVIASIHSHTNFSRDEMTRRLVRACENPYVNVIGHPTGRRVSGYAGYDFDYDTVFAAAARTGTALEIDGQPDRLDLPSQLVHRARSFGVTFAIDSDAHDARSLENIAYAVVQARRGWATRDAVLNARPLSDVRAFVAAKRSMVPG